jgi:hypothetical protein
VSNPRLRALHRGYIRQCLDALAESSNVIQLTSAEYSGPLEFTQFWLDTIVEWQQQSGRDVMIGLSAPKNVQDAILADLDRGPQVDVIDIRYWAYTADDGLYAPDGGQNLAPRQHLRKTRQKSGGAAAIVKAVREYRQRCPDKAITYNAEQNCPSSRDGWAVLVAGGSLANVKLADELARLVPTMRPVDGVVSGNAWCLGSDEGELLIYVADGGDAVSVNLVDGYRVRRIDADTGQAIDDGHVAGKASIPLSGRSPVLWLSPADAN